MIEKYRVLVMLKNNRFKGKYSQGLIDVYKDITSNEIRRVVGIGKFNETITKREMMENYRLFNIDKKINIVVTSIVDLNVNFKYYPITNNKREDEMLTRYHNAFEEIKYKATTLQSPDSAGNGIIIDDSKDVIKYRFDFGKTRMITYALVFAIDAVAQDRVRELMKTIEENV